MVLSIGRSLKLSLCLLAVCIASSGCEMLQSLSPAQMWKLNRQPNMDRGDAYFSVPAEMDPETEAGDVVSQLEAPELSK
jgi:hypothetical protein